MIAKNPENNIGHHRVEAEEATGVYRDSKAPPGSTGAGIG